MDYKQVIRRRFEGRWADFYGRYVNLSGQRNGSVTILSPFRQETVPSFTISLEGKYEGRWIDSGTKEFGDVFSFYGRMHNLNVRSAFGQICKAICEDFGISTCNGKAQAHDRKIIRSLSERGISTETAKAFGIREEPGDEKVTRRIIFPVYDKAGKLLGYKTHKSRHLKPDGTPAPKGEGVPAQIYPWSTLKQSDMIFLVDGELSVWAAHQAGYLNVVCPQGEGIFKQEWCEHFRNKVVRVTLDNDEAGRRGAEKVAQLLHGKAESVVIVQWPEGWKAKGDLEDWLSAGHRLEELTFRTWEPAPKIAIVTPPQARRVDFPLELPDSVWRGVVRDYRDMLARTTEASDAFHLFTFLACAGSVIGRRAFIRYGLSLHGNLYVCIVGPTAEGRKTTSLRHAERAIREVDSSWRVLRGLSSAEGLLSQVADPWEKLGKKGDVIASGGTNDKRLMVWLGEFSTLLKKAKQDSVSNIIPLLTEAFDCPPDLCLPTRNDPIVVTEPYISLICASTPSWLEDLADRDIAGGFGNRFVYVLGPPKDPIPRPAQPDARLMEKIVSHIGDVLLWLPESPEVTLTEPAWDLWSEFYVRWKSQVWPDEMFGALVQRIPDIAMKIALIFAILEKRTQIDPDILTAAIDAGGYATASAQRIFTDFHATRESKLEKRILKALESGPMKFRDLHQAVSGRYSAAEVNRALDSLIRAGQAWRREQGSTVICGLAAEE